MSDDKYLIRPKYSPGEHVDYVYKGLRGGAGPGGQYGLPVSAKAEKQIPVPQPIQTFHGIPGTTQAPNGQHMLAVPGTKSEKAFQKAIEVGQGARRRAIVDAKISDTEYRLMLRDNQEIVWAHVNEIEALDAISTLGDLVGPGGKSYQDLMDKEDPTVHCADCQKPLPNEADHCTLNGLGRVRCKPCFDEKLGG